MLERTLCPTLNIEPRETKPAGKGGGGCNQILSDGDDRRFCLGLKVSILGFFSVGKFAKYFFVWLDLSGDFKTRYFLGIQHVVLRIKYNQTCLAVVLIFNTLHCISFIKPVI